MKTFSEIDAGRKDLQRALIVAISAIIAIVGSFIGSGAVIGTPVQEASGGALSAEATLIAPYGSAFSIWSVIYAGLLIYAVWQFLPKQRSHLRHRRMGYPVAASLLLNAAWILSIQVDLLPLSVAVILALLAVLLWILVIMHDLPPVSRADGIITDGSFGLYLGWVSVATLANVAAWTVAEGFGGFGLDPVYWGISAILAAVSVGVVIAVYGRGRIAPAVSLVWGICWIAVGRTMGEPQSTPLAIVAVAGAVIIAAVTVAARLKSKERAMAGVTAGS